MYWDLNNQSTTYSDKILAEIKHTLKLISRNPFAGIQTESIGVRRIVILHRFGMYYSFSDTTIEFLGFVDLRNDPELNLFEEEEAAYANVPNKS